MIMLRPESPPPLAAIRRLQSDPDRSRQFEADQITPDIYTIHFDHITDVLSWEHWEVRRRLGKAGVRHLTLWRHFYGAETKSRLIGTAIDHKGRVKGFVDLRMPYATYEIDETLDDRAVNAVPEVDVIETGSGQLIEFIAPADLVEQAQPKYVPPYYRATAN